MSRNDPCVCGSGAKKKRCCFKRPIYDQAGEPISFNEPLAPGGYVCMVVEFPDAHTEYELYQMLKGTHPEANGKNQHLFACDDNRYTYRFQYPKLVTRFVEQQYPRHPYLIVGLIDGWTELHQRFGCLVTLNGF